MNTDYHIENFTDDISVLSVIILLIMVTFIVVIMIVFLILKKRMGKNISILTNQQIEYFDYYSINETNNINSNFVDEVQVLKNNTDFLNEQRDILLFKKFKKWLENDKPYLNPNLDLNLSAREIGTNRSYLSKSINSHGFGFSEYINMLRIREVIRIWEDENDIRNDYLIPEIASAVGFNTKSVFYSSFQKETGMTPAQYKEYRRMQKSD